MASEGAHPGARCAPGARRRRVAATRLVVLLSVFSLGLAGVEATLKPLGYDELFTVYLARLDLGQPTLLVTHQVVISGIAESAAENGEILVLRRDADGRLNVETRQSTAIR